MISLMQGPWTLCVEPNFNFPHARSAGADKNQILLDDPMKVPVNGTAGFIGSCDGNASEPASSGPDRIYNLGNEQAVEMLCCAQVAELCLGRKAQVQMLPLQGGDVPDTDADVSDLIALVGYRPRVSGESGVTAFFAWFRGYYRDQL